MTAPDAAMVSALREGRNYQQGDTRVALGSVLRLDPYAREREVIVKGMTVAVLGDHGFIRVPKIDDKKVTHRLNAILKAFYGEQYRIARTRTGLLFVTHPKLNSVSHKLNIGSTFVAPGQWWEVPGVLLLDPSRIFR